MLESRAPAADPVSGGRRGRKDQTAVRVGAALLTGAVTGALTSALQPHLSLPWFALADASSPWLLGGFVAGALQSRLRVAVAAGLAACALEVAAYYLTNAARGYGELSSVTVFWTACALFAVLGAALLAAVAWPIRRLLPPLLGATALLTLLGVVLYGPVLSFATGGQAF